MGRINCWRVASDRPQPHVDHGHHLPGGFSNSAPACVVAAWRGQQIVDPQDWGVQCRALLTTSNGGDAPAVEEEVTATRDCKRHISKPRHHSTRKYGSCIRLQAAQSIVRSEKFGQRAIVQEIEKQFFARSQCSRVVQLRKLDGPNRPN